MLIVQYGAFLPVYTDNKPKPCPTWNSRNILRLKLQTWYKAREVGDVTMSKTITRDTPVFLNPLTPKSD